MTDVLKDLKIICADTPKWPPVLLHRPTISTEISYHITKQDLPAKIKATALEISKLRKNLHRWLERPRVWQNKRCMLRF